MAKSSLRQFSMEGGGGVAPVSSCSKEALGQSERHTFIPRHMHTQTHIHLHRCVHTQRHMHTRKHTHPPTQTCAHIDTSQQPNPAPCTWGNLWKSLYVPRKGSFLGAAAERCRTLRSVNLAPEMHASREYHMHSRIYANTHAHTGRHEGTHSKRGRDLRPALHLPLLTGDPTPRNAPPGTWGR